MSDQFDPWAPETTPSEPTPAEAPAPQAAAIAQSTGTGEVVLTFKEGAGFDASWIVIHAESVHDANSILEDHDALKKLMTTTKNVAAHFRGGGVSAGGQRGGGGGGNNKPAGATQAPPGCPPAPDASYEYKAGVGAKGPWHAWMPPKGSGKEVMWLDKALIPK